MIYPYMSLAMQSNDWSFSRRWPTFCWLFWATCVVTLSLRSFFTKDSRNQKTLHTPKNMPAR